MNTGEGSRRFGGRRNYKGAAAVYLPDILSLAALEQFIHLGREGLHVPFVYFKPEIPSRLETRSRLPLIPGCGNPDKRYFYPW